MSKIMTWYVWMVTYLCRNVTLVCGASYHLLGSWIYFKIQRSGLTSSQILHQQYAILANCNIWQVMFPAIMSWPMTLSPPILCLVSVLSRWWHSRGLLFETMHGAILVIVLKEQNGSFVWKVHQKNAPLVSKCTSEKCRLTICRLAWWCKLEHRQDTSPLLLPTRVNGCWVPLAQIWV